VGIQPYPFNSWNVLSLVIERKGIGISENTEELSQALPVEVVQ
jgi:hypothetical protein